MKQLLGGMASFSVVLVMMACNPSANPEEETRIKSMDSTTQVVEVKTNQLEEQTKKVEASIEKLGKEFDDNKDNK